MKITKSKLKKIIKEEMEEAIQEGNSDVLLMIAGAIDDIQSTIHQLSKKAAKLRTQGVRIPNEGGGDTALPSAIMDGWTTLNKVKKVLYSMVD